MSYSGVKKSIGVHLPKTFMICYELCDIRLSDAYNSAIMQIDSIQKGAASMAQATITARVDERDKVDFDAFCSDVGLNTSTAINMYVKAVLRERRIPFEIMQNTDPFYSAANQAYVMKSVNELRAGKGTPHELIEVEDE
jgi:DNA-damage-inducible protein J